ncbi:uncharacterized protein ARMOST_10146 [Armillaria ostoyae]|uniref:Transcription factor TFIIIC triple barrel domain-containing protein n=1 Tax=Armillaria ostoyae TaxID=47428 RepID=A0A284RDI0_ARMOS|nr:uncharacterized protein ARMOST_10146 [Armillaria ostoyae]
MQRVHRVHHGTSIRKSALFGTRLLSYRDVALPRPQATSKSPNSDQTTTTRKKKRYSTLELGNVEPVLIPSCDSYHLVVSAFSLAGTVLKGRHETLLGTELLFSATEHSPEDAVSYMESTRQRICFREVQLEEKGKAQAKADACQLVLDRITRKAAPLPRRRRTRKMDVVLDAIVHLNSYLYRLQLRQNRLCICNGDFAWILLDCNRRIQGPDHGLKRCVAIRMGVIASKKSGRRKWTLSGRKLGTKVCKLTQADIHPQVN